MQFSSRTFTFVLIRLLLRVFLPKRDPSKLMAPDMKASKTVIYIVSLSITRQLPCDVGDERKSEK